MVSLVPGSAEAGPAEAEASPRELLGDLKAALARRDGEAVEKAAVGLSRAGGKSSMKALLGVLPRIPASEDSLYWALIRGAVSFLDRPGLEELGKYIRSRSSSALARDLVVALADNPSPECVHALEPVVLKGPQDLRILAATKLSRIHSPAAVDALIGLLEAEERADGGDPGDLAWIAADGLRAMTGQEFGPVAVNWRGWWKAHRAEPLLSPDEARDDAWGSGTAVDSLRGDRLREDGFVGVEEAPKSAVVVLSAVYEEKTKRDLNNDHMEHVLDTMGVPHTVVHREDFPAFDLSEAGIVLINCAQFHQFCICPTCKPGGDKKNRLFRCTGCDKHILFSAKLTEPEVEKLTDFVRRGGFLFCEDWLVKELVERAYPDYVAAGPSLKEGSMDVVPARGRGTHPYLRGIFTPRPVDHREFLGVDDESDDEDLGLGKTIVIGPGGVELGEDGVKVRHEWSVDDESFAFQVKDSRRVTGLLSSGQLQKRASGNGLVALAFRPGNASISPGHHPVPRGTPGVVVLVLSHFGHQTSSSDEYSIQNLLLNVLIDANRARLGRGSRAR